VGLAPTVHPQTRRLYYRDLQGGVWVADFSGNLKRRLYAPPDPARIFIDAKGQATPLSEEEGEIPFGGTVTAPLAIFAAPEKGAIPPPVQFLGPEIIQFETIYGDGKIRGKTIFDLKSEMAIPARMAEEVRAQKIGETARPDPAEKISP
jgi:hypothetical protein